MKPTLHILTGCTATGKTEWALRWAEARGAEIVSCDSLLFYRGLDIGTAKPTRTELARVPHHLIDILDVTERMDVANYVTRAKAAAVDIHRRGREVLVVGGSGFYLRSFLAPVADEVEVPASLRAEVEAMTLDEARARLLRLNPDGLGPLDPANPRRVKRALERCLASGRRLAELAAEFAAQRGPFDDWQIKLTRIDQPPEELKRRIDARVAAMLAAGLVDEVRAMITKGLKDNPSASRAIGYREVIECLEGRRSEDTLAAQIAHNTRGLVKKQRTWFRTQLPAHRVVLGAEADVGGLFAA